MFHVSAPLLQPPSLFIAESEDHDTNARSIVCVHGLGGTAGSTWYSEQSGKSWTSDADFLDDALKDKVRIMTYNYNADVAANMTGASIALHATDLLGLLLAVMGRGVSWPLVFVAHGFGGQIVKKALLLAQHVAAYRSVGHSMAAILFLGTPHQADDAGALLAAVRVSATLMARRGSRVADEDVREFAEAVRETNAEFQGPPSARLKLCSFWEGKTTLVSPKGEEPYETMVSVFDS